MQGPRSLPKTKKIPWRSHGLIENFAWRWKPEGNRLLKQAKANKNTSKGDQLKWRCLSSWLINIPCQSHSQSVGRLVGWSVGKIHMPASRQPLNGQVIDISPIPRNLQSKKKNANHRRSGPEWQSSDRKTTKRIYI